MKHTQKTTTSAVVLLGCSMLLAVTCPPAVAQQEQDQGPTVLAEPLEPLVPKHARSEGDEDRLAAAVHFAQGRLLLQRGDRPLALRHFQRAWRYDPQAVSLVREIVGLARRLRRQDEAARYAVIAGELQPEDPQMLIQLAALLVEQRKFRRASALFEQALPLFEEQAQPLRALALRVELGRLHFLLGQLEQAAAVFSEVGQVFDEPQRAGITRQQLDQLVSKPDLLYKLMAETYLEVGRHDEAAERFRQALQDNEHLQAFNLARVDFARGNLDAALEKLERYFQARQSSAGARPYELLGQLLRQKHADEKQAEARLLEKLQELFDQDAGNTALGYHLAARLRTAKDWSAAEEIYLDLLLARPTLAVFQGLTEIYYRQGKISELVEILGESLEKNGSTEALTPQIALVTRDEPFLEQLLDSVVREAEQSPQSISQAMRLVTALMAVGGGKFERAETLYRLALEAEGQPKHTVMQRIGLAMFFADRAERAAEIFQQAIDESPGSDYLATYYYYLAGAMQLADQTDQAVRAAEKAASLDDSIRFQIRPAWVLYHARRYEQAEQRYQDLLKRFDAQHDSPEIRRAMRDARLVLSNVCVQQHRLPAAEEWLEQVLDEFPDDVAALNDLGYLWADQAKRLERALSMVQRAVEAEPENEAYRDSLGWAYFRLGRFEEAVRELEKASAGDDPDGVILDHLGDAHLELGDPGKARQAWQRAVDAFDPEVDAKARQTAEEKIKQHP